MTACPRCGSTKRNKNTLHCVCGENVEVDGQEPLFAVALGPEQLDLLTAYGTCTVCGAPREGNVRLGSDCLHVTMTCTVEESHVQS